jgi:hypothetical protein
MVNDDVGLNQTYAQDFIFRWDDQNNLAVNGKTFADFFKYYEIRVYDRYQELHHVILHHYKQLDVLIFNEYQ